MKVIYENKVKSLGSCVDEFQEAGFFILFGDSAPEELRDYVALHELVHFLHHDHGPGFYARMDALMADWRRRRKALKSYSGALERE